MPSVRSPRENRSKTPLIRPFGAPSPTRGEGGQTLALDLCKSRRTGFPFGSPSASRALLAATVGLVLLLFLAPASVRAQDGSDAAIDALIKELDADKKQGDDKKPEAPRQQDSRAPQKPEAKPADKPKTSADKPKPAELTGKDKELDELLQSLGETKDKPDTQDERKRPGGPDMDKDKDKDKDQKQDHGQGGKDQDKDQGDQERDRQPRMTDKDRAVDEELERLAGRRRKKTRDDEGDGPSSGPMREIIKEMRDVEKRLGEPDTGEETRGRQQQLVKQLDKIIEQIRQQQQQGGQGMAQRRQGEQEGDQAGDNPGGAPNQRPRTPTDKHSLAKGKDQWGHLPPEQRQEMENINKEEALPTLEGLIRRYYVSVSRGKLNRGD